MRFGEKLRILRQRRSMILNELVQLTGYATHTPLSQIETGKRKPTLDFVYKVTSGSDYAETENQIFPSCCARNRLQNAENVL